MIDLNFPLVIRRDELSFILTALINARPDMREAFELVAQSIGISQLIPPPPPPVIVELPHLTERAK